jgi:phosphopantetheinyl transferase
MPLHSVLKYKNITSVTPSVAEVYIWHITEEEEDLISLVSTRDLFEFQKKYITHPRRRIEWLAVRALLHNIYPEAQINYHPNGKPYLKCPQECPYISISHTHGWVALVLSPSSIGIDIEGWSERPFQLAHRFLSPDEVKLLKSAEHPYNLATQLWTAKEAAFKCFDQTYTRLITDVTIFPSAECLDTFLVYGVGKDDKAQVYKIDLEEFSLALCFPHSMERFL